MVLSPKIVQWYSGVTTGGGSRLTAAATKKVKRPGALTVPGKRIKDIIKTKYAVRCLANGMLSYQGLTRINSDYKD